MLELLNGFVVELRNAGLPVSLTENLDAMEAVQHIPIEVLGDTEDEPPLLWGEWGFVEFSNHSNGTPYTGGFFGLGIFIIIDDDTPSHGELASRSVRRALSAAG